MRVAVIINTGSGPGTPTGMDEIWRGLGDRAAIQFVHSQQLTAAVRDAAGDPAYEAVVVGGGDGTLSTAAGELVRSGQPLGVLPLGTLNHFAQDLGIPAALDEAVKTITEGDIARVDVGEVNGRIFLNNVSLGLYAHAIRQRDHRARPRFVATATAVWQAFHWSPSYRVRVISNGTRLELRTRFLFVGNNVCELRFLDVGRRSRLDAGQLCVFVSHRPSRRGMLAQAGRALVGKLEEADDFESFCASGAMIEVNRTELALAVDGEAVRLRSPLHFRSRPGALRVIVPAAVARGLAA